LVFASIACVSVPIKTGCLAALWQAVADDSLQIVSTDHCPFWFDGGTNGRPAGKELGKGSFALIPNGCPGIEDRMMVLYSCGVRSSRFSLNRWVELLLHQPGQTLWVVSIKGRDRSWK
jgi:dihydropyrimidinase